MKGFIKVFSMLAIAAFVFGACSDDKDDGGILNFKVPAVYFSKTLTQAEVEFEAIGVGNFYVSQKPRGWEENITIDPTTKKISIVLPDELKKTLLADEEEKVVDRSGNIILSGVNPSGFVKSAKLFVGVVPSVDLSPKPANCYVVCKKDTHYTFRATKGDGTPIQVDHASIVWQDHVTVIEHVGVDGEYISFYVGSSDDKMNQGNAVIGGYDAQGELVWSWHIWATEHDPEAQSLNYANGYQMMDRNLGAINNANQTEQERLDSYGVFYQWGRRNPFPGPSTYRGNYGASLAIYDGTGQRAYQDNIESSAIVGVRSYGEQNPTVFILGTKENGYDWLWEKEDQAWAETKTINDPCPYGWTVAPVAAFSGLRVENTPSIADSEMFGWNLTDGTISSLYMGAGRKVYKTGKFLNIYNPLPTRANPAFEAQPWEGLYWTKDAGANRQAKVLHFWYEKKTNTSGITTSESYQRANGMTVRCVRVR